MNNRCDVSHQAALQNERQARQVCEKLCAEAEGLPRLKTIAAVGAYDAVIGGKRVDSKRLTGILSYLLRSGILIDPDFNIDPVNFSDRRDFLQEDRTYDMVFVSFILREHVGRTHTYQNPSQEQEALLQGDLRQFKDYYGCALSPEHDDTRWQDRFISSGAEMIVTYGGPSEIGTEVVCGGRNDQSLVALIPTPQRKVSEFYTRTWNEFWEPDVESATDLKVLYNDAANDLPMPWLGFAAHRDYVRGMAPHVVQETCLGRTIREVVPL